MADDKHRIDVNIGQNTSNLDIPSDYELENNISNFSIQEPHLGYLKLAQVVDADIKNKTVTVYVVSDKQEKEIPYSGYMSDPNTGSGMWFGLKKGDVVLLGTGFGFRYYIVSKIGNYNTPAQNKSLPTTTIDKLLLGSRYSINPLFDNFTDGSFLINTEDSTHLLLEPNRGATLGSPARSFFDVDTSSFDGIASIVGESINNLSSSGMSYSGNVLRNKQLDIPAKSSDTITLDYKINSKWYQNSSQIGMDPTVIISDVTNQNYKRNLPLNEYREVITEFPETYNVESDIIELKKQDKDYSGDPTYSNRAKRKDDSLSLNLISPNKLIEIIKGTVVDALGNVVDINRFPIPIGADGLASLSGDKSDFNKVKELHRKGLAFHWELNARKDPSKIDLETGLGASYAPKTNEDFKRARSRLFFDADKEGQLKINVPSSSENGNVSLLTRYENYNTINPYTNSGKNDYATFYRDGSKQDILLDAFGVGCVELKGNDKLIPKDRITGEQIKVGTVYHDISKTCIVPIPESGTNQASGILSGPDLETQNTDSNKTQRKILNFTDPDSVVSKVLNIDGENANAGGRSITAAIDGMINISIGANTADRQSAWYDYQGGIVTWIGADKNGISSTTQTDGDYYLQVGGATAAPSDSRFPSSTYNDLPTRTRRCEIRVIQGNGGQYTRVLIDQRGVMISSAGRLDFRSDQDISLTAGGNLIFNAESIRYFSEEPKSEVIAKGLHKMRREPEECFETDAGETVMIRDVTSARSH